MEIEVSSRSSLAIPSSSTKVSSPVQRDQTGGTLVKVECYSLKFRRKFEAHTHEVML